MSKAISSETLLLRIEDTANIADDTLRIAHSLVRNGIGGDGCDVDELVAISCVLDRVTAQIRQASKIAGAERKAQGNKAG
jgi:hypothetical protein